MLLGYNTNGFAFHRLEDALLILHELGYGAVGITFDVHLLNPFDSKTALEAAEVRRLLDRLSMRCVVETGARFLLDSRRKHQPTLVDPDFNERRRRVELLERSLDVAAILNADALSFWSGSPPDDASDDVSTRRLLDSLPPVLKRARALRIPLALEPEPDMVVASTADGMEVVRQFNDEWLGLTVDVGHAHCLGEGALPSILRSVGDRLLNVHIEDMKRGVHDHLMFGEGEMEFGPIFESLRDVGYKNGVYVELSRHAHDAVNAAAKAMEFLKPFF